VKVYFADIIGRLYHSVIFKGS